MLSRAALMLLQMAVLARLLVPGDFGVMALVAAVVAFAQLFSDLGVSNAIIHHQSIKQETLSSLYWLNVSASACLMLLLMLLSPLIAAWYQEPRMQPVLLLVSLSFFIVALGQQLRVTAEKKLRFRQLALIEVSSSLLGLIAAVVVAVAGGGVYALVARMLAASAVATALYWAILADGWRPMWRLRLSEVRDFMSFGAYMIGFSVASTVNLQADILIGGRVLGTSSLGAYSLPKEICWRLTAIINPIVARVGLPLMAMTQGDRTRLKSIFLNTVLMTASANFPLYLLIAVFAPEIVAIVFGSQWQESVLLLRLLALWGLLRSAGGQAGSLALAMGRANLAFWWSAGLALVLVPTYWVAAHYAIEGLALSMPISMLLVPLPQWLIVIRPLCGARFAEYFKQLAMPLGIAVLAALAGWTAAIPFDTALFRLAAGLLGGGLLYLVLSRWLNRIWFAAVTELLLGQARSAKWFA